MRKGYLILIIVGLIVLIAILTNPDQYRHKEVLKDKITLMMQKSLAQPEGKLNEGEQTLGLIVGGTFTNMLINNLVSTDNYLLFSTTKISWQGKTKVIGIGFFGNVYLTNKLDEAMDEGLLEKQ